ncbi:uncharacterized protein LOC142879683 isoform X5 [Nelusetta ayraudi]|uniref:uncharacterized protein LOC142879683 isoform X5 n=1 Tax=Nelusetta ayraudi TaxID=303726 RepID=UPI003F71BE62
MCGVEWMKASARLLPFLLLLRGSAAAAAAVLLENDTISLNCDQLIDDQTKCDATTWVFYRSIKTPVELITLGQITSTRLDVNKVHRLKVLENCSLEIKSVTAEDAGRYHCQQYRSGKKEGQDTVVELAVVTNWWWLGVIATVLLAAACTLTCATVLWCKRNKARKTHTTDNLSINKNMGAENRQCSDAVQANEEDGVFYTSVNFTGIRKAKVRDKNDESRFEEVTYSTVKASSTDPSHIYASVNPSR